MMKEIRSHAGRRPVQERGKGPGRRRLAAVAAAGLFMALLKGAAAAAADAQEDPWAAMLEAQTPLPVSVAFDAEGALWRVRSDGEHVLVDRSLDEGRSFDAPRRINPAPERIATSGDNRPKLAIARDGTLHVSYTRMGERPFSGDIRLSRSEDGGARFSAPITVNEDRQPISHRFDAPIVDGDGNLHLVWIDKRDEHAAVNEGGAYAGAALYHAIVDSGGRRTGPDTRLVHHSCECCRIALALDTDGTPVVFWRHVFDGNVRDHAAMRLDGRDSPRRVTHGQWEVEACPHHGPALAIEADGTRHFAWFDNGPRARGLFHALSRDGGATLSEPMPVGEPARRPAHPALLATDGAVWLAWREMDGDAMRLQVMHSADGGRQWSDPATAATTADAADHPQLVAWGDRVLLSWNTATDGHRLIRLTPLEVGP